MKKFVTRGHNGTHNLSSPSMSPSLESLTPNFPPLSSSSPSFSPQQRSLSPDPPSPNNSNSSPIFPAHQSRSRENSRFGGILPSPTSKRRAQTNSPPPTSSPSSNHHHNGTGNEQPTIGKTVRSNSNSSNGSLKSRMVPLVTMVTPRSGMGITHWASDSAVVADRYRGLRLETDRLVGLKDEVVKEGAKKGEEKVRQGLVRAVEIAEQLFRDLHDIAYEFASTLENEKTVTLQLQLANLAIADQRRKLEAVLSDKQRLENEMKKARQQILQLQLQASITSIPMPKRTTTPSNTTTSPIPTPTPPKNPDGKSFNRRLSDIDESAGAVDESEINLNPSNEAEAETTIDQLVLVCVSRISKSTAVSAIPGLNKHVIKIRPNVYNVGGYTLNLEFHNKKVLVRVGGGFVDFEEWCGKHQPALLKYVQVTDAMTPQGEGSGQEPPKLSRRLTPSMILRSTDGGVPPTAAAAMLRKSRSSANIVRHRRSDESPLSLSDEFEFLDSDQWRSNTVSNMISDAVNDESLMLMQRDRVITRHKSEIEKLSSAIESEKLRQQAKVQSEIKMKQEVNELLELRVKVEQYRGQRDESLLAIKSLRKESDAKDKEIALLRQQMQVMMQQQQQPQNGPLKIQQALANGIDAYALQQQQVVVLRQQRDDAIANLKKLHEAYERLEQQNQHQQHQQ
eukprot:c17970_g1_i1.p1 GENE.c17970_g1_i1~~c17970_g1_i1.p1  ORF type:complete len:695 (+),score=192.58 c17970_g1_i1:51-2087(+)